MIPAEILTAVAAEMRRIGELDSEMVPAEELYPSEEIVRNIAASILVLKTRGWGQW